MNAFLPPFAPLPLIQEGQLSVTGEKLNCSGFSLPRSSVVRLTDHSDMTMAVNCGRKTTKT